MSNLATALKQKFSSPRQVLRRLGIDESVLEEPREGTREAERTHDKPLTSLRSAVDALLKEHADDTDPFVTKIRGLMNTGGEESGAEDDDTPIEASPQTKDRSRVSYDDFKDYLAERGFSDDEISEAMEHARDHVRHRNANGRDRRFGRDVLPRNARRGGMGGHISGGRTDKVLDEMRESMSRIEPAMSMPTGANRYITDHGYDSHRRGAMDASPTRRQLARLHARYPGLCLVGDVNGTRLDVPNIDTRSKADAKYGLSRIGVA